MRKFFIIYLVITLLNGCVSNDSANKREEFKEEIRIERVGFVIDNNLSTSHYSRIDGYTPKEGFVPDADMAFQIAEIILMKIYGKEQIEKQRPFYVKLKDNIWYIKGHLDDGLRGGVAYIEIQKNDGKILKVIHEK